MRPVRSSPIRAAAATGITALAAAFTVAATAVPAAAANTVKARYKVTGSTHLAKPNADVKLGPGKLIAHVNLKNGHVRANLKLPPATGSFKELGLIPVTATSEFINNGPTTGTVNLNTGKVSTTSHITLKIDSLSVAGIPVPVGDSCETKTPATVHVTSRKGFSILKGGNLSGTYTLPKFAHCRLATLLINLTLPGPDNTIRLHLGKAKIG